MPPPDAITGRTVAELAAAMGLDLPESLADKLAERLQSSLQAAAELRQLDLGATVPSAVIRMQRWR